MSETKGSGAEQPVLGTLGKKSVCLERKMAVPGKWGFLRTPCIDSVPDLLSVDIYVLLIRRLFILCLCAIVAVATLLCVE
jgi:hypothetical protein